MRTMTVETPAYEILSIDGWDYGPLARTSLRHGYYVDYEDGDRATLERVDGQPPDRAEYPAADLILRLVDPHGIIKRESRFSRVIDAARAVRKMEGRPCKWDIIFLGSPIPSDQ
jgi:hypothetical protein